MATVSEPPPKHIPAWKRLGLKLKNAEEKPPETALQINGVSSQSRLVRKRKSIVHGEYDGPGDFPTKSAKKPKNSKHISLDTDSTKSVTLSADSVIYSPSISSTPSHSKRKSVSFAPETKAEDGDSVKQIYQTWLTSQQAADPDFDASKLSPALKPSAPIATKSFSEAPSVSAPKTSPPRSEPTTPTPKKKKKKESNTTHANSKPTSTPATTNEESSDYVHPALNYLTAHHTSPSIWKFNKNHQNYLIKHLFHPPQLPSSYDQALAPYLKGLASENTRARIRRDALAIREDDEKWLESPDSDPSLTNQNDSKLIEDNDAETNKDTMGVERETPEQGHARRRRDYLGAVERMKHLLHQAEDFREGVIEKVAWEQRLLHRRRAEIVLWGVGETGPQLVRALDAAAKTLPPPPPPSSVIAQKTVVLESQPAFRQQMGPKKIVFGETGGKPTATAAPVASSPSSTTTTTTSQPRPQPTTTDGQQKKKRKRKRSAKDRLGAIPDDGTSSSSSGSDGEGESEDEELKRERARKKARAEEVAAQRRELERARREVEEEMSSDESSSSSDDEESSSGRDGEDSAEEGKGKEKVKVKVNGKTSGKADTIVNGKVSANAEEEEETSSSGGGSESDGSDEST